jgi:hypothetical protein
MEGTLKTWNMTQSEQLLRQLLGNTDFITQRKKHALRTYKRTFHITTKPSNILINLLSAVGPVQKA